MWRRTILGFLFVAFLSLASTAAWAQSCTTTLSVGGNVASAVSSAATGAVICLNSGNWGTVALNNITKAGYVTVKSTTGQGAQGYFQIGASQYIHVDSVTLAGAIVNSCSRHIIISNSTSVPNSDSGIYITGDSCVGTNLDITVDGVVLDRVGQASYEGRISIRDGNNVTVKNSTFTGTPSSVAASDGLFLNGSITNIYVGPGNVFSNILEPSCGGVHCDMIQTYGGPCSGVYMEGNIFRDSSTAMLNESSCSGTLKNNIIINVPSFQMHTWNPLTVEHNTWYNSFWNINQSSGFQNNVIIRNNIFHASSWSPAGTYPCSVCTESYSLYSSGCGGTNCITGTPTYIGGAPPPSTWAGWQLSSGSPGRSNGSDGMDRGTLYYGVAQAPDTEAPTTPTSPSATTASATQIDLSWTASTDNVGIAGYNVERCTGSGCSNWTEVQATNGIGTTWSDTGLAASTLYRYRIRARDTATPTPNYSGYSTIVQATTAAPGIVTVTPSIVLGAAHGSISPNTPQNVTQGTTTQFTVTAASGYKAVMGGTCGGNLAGTTYTTNTIASACSVQASFIPTSCALDPSNSTATNVAMTAQTGTFTYLFSVIPAATSHDLTLGHTNGNWTAYTSYSTTVRFASNGVVDARNGTGYGADVVYNYLPNTQYNVRIVANVLTDTYNAYIAVDGQAETQIASNYAFRTTATSLNNFAYVGLSGAATGAYACPLGLSGGDTTAPTVQARRIIASGNSFELDLDEPAGSVSGAAGLTLSASGGAVTLAGCSTASDIITCSTSRQILGAETVTASYSGAGGIADTSGNPLASFGSQAVTNNSAQSLVALSLLTPPDGTRYRKEVSSTTIGLTTSKAASCRRASTSGVVWSSMTPYTTTGSTSHSSTFPMLAGVAYQVCSRCLDTAAQQYSTDACTHFSVRSERKR